MSAPQVRWCGSQRGFIAAEFVAAIALVMIPMLMLVVALPRWAEHRHAAAVAAGEAARIGARSWPDIDATTAEAVAYRVLANRGISRADAAVAVTIVPFRGGRVTASITVRLRGFRFGDARVGDWSVTVTRTERIDDYRSA